MEQRSSWNANYLLTSQGIPYICWNPKVHHRVHKILPPFTILSQINPFHASSNYLLKIHLILFSNLFIGLPSDHSPSRSQLNPCKHLSLYILYAWPISFFFMWSLKQYTVRSKIMKFLIMQSPRLSSSQISSALYSQTPSVYFRILTF